MSCLICKEDIGDEPSVKVREKGLETLIKCSLLRQDNLDKEFRETASIVLHTYCRQKYTNIRVNKYGELKVLSAKCFTRKVTANNFPFVPVNNDYAAFTNYLLSKDTLLNTPETSVPAKTEESTSNKEEEHQKSADNISICYEQDLSGLPVESESCSIKYNQIIVQGNSFPQLEYNIPVLNATPSEHSTLGPQYNSSRAENPYALNDEIDPSKPFPFEHLCFICAKDISSKYIDNEKKKPANKRNVVQKVSCKGTKDTCMYYLTINHTLRNQSIIQRIQDVDLVQVNAKYHKKCLMATCQKRQPQGHGVRGRPKCPQIAAAMEDIYKYIDGTSRTNYTIKELMDILDMHNNLPDTKTLISKMKNKYPGKVYFTSVPGRNTVITIIKETTNIFDPNQEETDCLIWKEHIYNTDFAKKAKKDKKEKLQEEITMEETTIEEKRKSLRLRDKINKGKESTQDITEVNIEKEKRGLKRKKRKSKQTLNIENETNLLEDDDKMFSDGDYSPDEDNNVICEQSESFIENNYKTMFICRICLSSDRTLDVLGEYSDMYRRICADIVPDDTKLFLVCWECRAVLVQATRFRERAEEAHKLLMSEVQPKCLSTMSITAPDVSIISSGCENQQLIQNETENSFDQTMDANDEENSIKKYDEAKENKDLDQEIDVQYSPRPVAEEEGSMDDLNTLDDAASDDETNGLSDAKRPRRSVVNKVTETKERENDDDDEDDDPEKSDSSSETSDTDWNSPAPEKTPKKSQLPKKKPLPLRFRIKVQDFDVDSKIKREPLAESELGVWLERERRSAYFKLSKLRKCHRCITVIPPGEDHETVYHSKINPLVCHICKFTCSSEAVLSPHIARHYFVLHCALCSYQCYNEQHMRCHVDWHKKSVCCLDCNEEFKSVEEFQEHSAKPHPQATCDHCGKNFAHKLFLQTHIQLKHTPQVCTVCNATFKSLGYLKEHMDLKHHVERTEAAYCVQCDIQFDNEKLLKQHVYTSVKHASERKPIPSKLKPKKPPEVHKCPDCPNSYRNARSLHYHHTLVHENKIQFYCEQCDKAFPRKFGLQWHMKLKHEGYVMPKDKICEICGQGFNTRRILTHHIRTHTGERPFPCPRPHCGKQFAQKSAMLTHVRHVHDKVQRQGHLATSTGNMPNLGDIATSSGDMLNLGDIATSSGNMLNLGDIATSSGNMLNLDDIPF